MNKLENHRQIIKSILNGYAQIQPAYGEISRQTVFDQEQGHYQLINTGWENRRRVYGCLIHLDIKDDGKIWIQYDGTETGIANQLVEQGIPKNEIVLAYQSDYMRSLSDFAVS
ncbi:MAG: XisI protein [Cyanobacteria bacterium J06634_5]